MDDVELSVHGLDINYIRNGIQKKIRYSKVSTIIFFFLLLLISVIFFFLQISDNSVFSSLIKYSKIKNNITSWKALVLQKTNINSALGKRAAINRPDLFKLKCIDFGNYFLPIKLNSETFLPEAIRRGDGDGWMIKKANKHDPAAEQFCNYIIMRYSETITCGNQMFNILGYSGYFEAGHWCQLFLDVI